MRQRRRQLGLSLFLVCCLVSAAVQSASAGIEIAEDLLVDLRSEDLKPGPVTEWLNHGSLGGSFVAVGNPVVEDVADWQNVVSLDGDSYFEGPTSVPGMEGSDPRSVEIWTYKVGLSGEQTMISWAHRGGPDGTNFGFNYADNTSWGAVGHWGGGPDMGWGGDHAPNPALETWWHLAYTYDGTAARLYVNGDPAGEETTTLNTHAGNIIRVGAQGDGTGANAQANMNYIGAIAQVRIHDGVLTPEQIQINAQIRVRSFTKASNPSPDDEVVEVLTNASLSWSPGESAQKHTVYLGTVKEDVDAADPANPLGVLVSEEQDATTFVPGDVLEFGQTYYWRVDEVNGAPDFAVTKGDTWSFAVESFAYPIETITATASSSQAANMGPERTIDGSGLDALDQHSIDAMDMWTSGPGVIPAWIQYEFDQPYKLHEMWVWNSNQIIEAFMGLGAKDVTVETSVDGMDWVELADVPQFAQGEGAPTYLANTTVAFAGTLAQYVRITIHAGYGLLPQYGLSEVRIFQIPTAAREPNPASGTVVDSADVVLNWRVGREAVSHEVYLGTSPDDLALIASTTEASYDLSEQGIEYGRTYYWQINEVNEAGSPSVYAGEVWNFTVPDYATVEGFETYDDHCNRIFFAWQDGLGHNGSEACAVAPYNGNGTGSIVGNAEAPFAEQTIVYAGSQSMPLSYDNVSESISEMSISTNDLAIGRDWSSGAPETLVLWILGDADNAATDRLYLKVDNAKVLFDGDLTQPAWTQWNIDLDTLNVNLSNIQTLSIGVERIGGSGGSGMLFIDEIRLYRVAPGAVETISLINDFDSLAVGANMHDVDGWEGWWGDGQWAAKITDTVAYSGANALEIVGARDDLVPNWPLVDSGVYVASVMQYVPAATDGLMHYGPLSSYGPSWDEMAWLGTLLSNCSTGFVYVSELDSGSRTETPLIRDQWVELRIVMNFDANTCDFYYGDVLLGSRECPSAQGFDIWPDDDVDVIYYDDFRFESL